MKRAILTTGERADNLEQVKQQTKHVSECERRANASLGEAGSVGALFTPQSVGVRARLREACERVVLTCPSQARRMEEILWRKVYYDPLTQAKKMRKGNSWSVNESVRIHNHLWEGMAYFHQLMHSLPPPPSHSLTPDLQLHTNEETSNVSESSGGVVVGVESLQRCLTCLADLTRYMLDLPSPPPHHLPVRYYLQALQYQREGGLVHSNLATVYTSADQPLLAVAHYLRALTCEKSFEGAESNLKRLLEKSRSVYENNSEDGGDQTPAQHHRLFLHSLLTLVSCFIHNRDNQEVARVCQDVLVRLGRALESCDDTDNDTSDTTNSPTALQNGHDSPLPPPPLSVTPSPSPPLPPQPPQKTEGGFTLTAEAMVLVCTVLSLCIKRLKKQGWHTSMAQALLVSVVMTLVTHVSTRLEQRISLVDHPFLSTLMPKEEKKGDEDDVKEGSDDVKGKEGKDGGGVDGGLEIIGTKTKKNNNNNNNNRRRRRRRLPVNGHAHTDDEQSGADWSESDDEGKDDDMNESSEEDEDEEEEDMDLSQLCSSEDDDDSDEDVKVESDEDSWCGLSAGEHLELISKEGMLSAVGVGCGWLGGDADAIQLCLKTADALWTTLARLLNLLRVDLAQLRTAPNGIRSDVIDLIEASKQDATSNNSPGGLSEALKKTPLPEDLMLHTLIPTYRPPTPKALNLKSLEMVLLRVKRFGEFGEELSSRCDTPLWCSSETHLYTFSMQGVVQNPKSSTKDSAAGGVSRESSVSPTEDEMLTVGGGGGGGGGRKEWRRLAGMQSLTAQWLQHEVRSLEERTARRATLGLYLVPDATVLTTHLHAVKMLLARPTHMIIIPQTVIDLLDQQKRESVGARDAIRWLEIKFRHGSRFIRSQRPHERTHLPLIKYPRRKDKEAWEWYQILECCHYLSAQVQQNSRSVKAATVTLITGEKHNSSGSSFSHSGLTNAAGAVLEHIDEFMRKWQTSTKGHS